MGKRILWVVLVAAPLIASFVGYMLLPSGVDQIAIHWDLDGNPNGWGSPMAIFGLGAIMMVTNLVMAICYFRSDDMYDAGLIHGVKKVNAPKVLLITAVAMVILAIIIVGAMVYMVVG